MATKPNCGCCLKNFEIASVINTTGSLYNLTFNACNVNPLIVQVRKDCVIWYATTITPTSGVVQINLSGVPDGEYEILGSSPNCEGYANSTFKVTHGGTIPVEGEELEAAYLSAAGINANTIRIGWTHEGPVDEYVLQQFVSGAWVALSTFEPASRSVDITELTVNVELTFRLGAKKGTQTMWSNTVKATPTTDVETVTPPIVSDFVFLTNTTGYFDSNDFVNKITGLAPGCTVVRWCVRWDEYETSPGVFSNDKLAARMAQVDGIYTGLGLQPPHYAINFWGVRHDNKIEEFVPYDDVVVFQGGKRATGDLVIGKSYGLGSFSSAAYRTRVSAVGHSITKWFKANAPGRLYYITYSSGQTEERFNYLWDNPDASGNYDSHGDFSTTALKAFRTYCLTTFGTSTPWGELSAFASLPTADWSGNPGQAWVVNAMMSTTKGGAWTNFVNKEMENTVIAFKNGCKSANENVAVIDYIADFFRNQGNGFYCNSVSTMALGSQLDGLYHSDGDTMDDDDYAKKYSFLDSAVPTWGQKLYFCELDYKDMYMVGTGLPSKDAIKRTARAIYKKGGAGIHFAMSMTLAQAQKAREACVEILQEIADGTLTRLDRSGAGNYTFNLSPMVYGGNEELLNYYKTATGGTESNVVNLKLIKNY